MQAVKKIVLVFYCFLFFNSQMFAQKIRNLDSLERILDTLKTDTITISKYLKLVKKCQ